jgi:RNA polymerase sigma factor (sigma-70 family)
MNQPDIHIDNRCWSRLLEGDKEALFELYNRYYHSLLFIGLKHIHDSDLVKDVIQQQFLYFWEKRTGLLPAKNVKSYIIISFLRRLTSDWVRSRKTVSLEVAWSRKEEEEFCESSCEELLILKDGHDSICRNLAQVINSLPARQRELIQLRFYDGLGYDTIAEKTGLAHRTIYNKIHEALARIREGLSQSSSSTGVKSIIYLLMAFLQGFLSNNG